MKVFEFATVKFYVGQTAKENWELIDKAKSENQDFIWFHLNSFPSPHVIMWSSISILENNEIKDNPINLYLLYGANLCKEYSKYNNYKDLKIMYTTIKKISKTDTIGEVEIKGKNKIIKI